MKRKQLSEARKMGRGMKLVLWVIPISMMMWVCSCNRKEAVYSCNQATNEKAKKNRSINQSISRYALAHLDDLDYQMAVFLSLSAQNKVRIFREKIQAEQQNTNLSPGEVALLNELINYLKPEHYSTLNAQFLAYAHSRESILRNEYGWDDAKVFIFTNSWMLEAEIGDYIAQKMKAPGSNSASGGGGGGSMPCTCYYGYYCWIKGGGSGTCKTGSCYKPHGGCGVFGSTNCDGICD